MYISLYIYREIYRERDTYMYTQMYKCNNEQELARRPSSAS